MIYFTVAAVLLYLLSDWILNQIEIRRGERLEHRSLTFFAIILVLSLVLFNLIQRFQPAAESGASTAGSHSEEGAGGGIQ